MNNTPLTPRTATAHIHHHGASIVRQHVTHRGDPTIIRAVTETWTNWTLRNNTNWETLTDCWNDFATTKPTITYTPPPCKDCHGHRRFMGSWCPRCLGKPTPKTERILLTPKTKQNTNSN
jgi:hypothetical protein